MGHRVIHQGSIVRPIRCIKNTTKNIFHQKHNKKLATPKHGVYLSPRLNTFATHHLPRQVQTNLLELEMKKTLIASAVAAACAFPMIASAGTTLYGDLRYSVNSVDDDGAAVDGLEANDNASRIGVKGSYDMGNGMTAIFHIQAAANMDANGGIAFGQRFNWGGLKGSFGTVLYGRASSPYKMAGVKLDPFYDTNSISQGLGNGNAGATHGLTNLTNGFLDNVIAYITPNFNGISGNVVLVIDDTNADEHAYNYGITYSANGITAGIQHIDLNDTFDGILGFEDSTRYHAKYAASNWSIAASIEDATQNGGAIDQDNLYIAGTYNVSKATKLAISYGDQDADGANASDGDAWTMGVFHSLYKKTTIHALYSTGDSDVANNDIDSFAVGISQKFSM